MNLRELFDRPAKWVEVDNDMGFAYQFQTKDGKGYEVTLDVDDDFVYEVIFADEAGRIDLTGAGNAAEVIGTVIAILKAHVKEHNMPDLSFSAEGKEPSRVKLYTKLVNKLSGDMGYDVEAINHMGMKSWKLTKKQNENINELFDKPAKWKEVDNDMGFAYQFQTKDGKGYEVTLEADKLEVDNNVYEVTFADEAGRTDLTGAGNAVEVLSTVIAILKDHAKKHNMPDLSFKATGIEPSRVKLYTTLVNKLSDAMGYDVETNRLTGAKRWKLTKKQTENINELLDKPLKWQPKTEQMNLAEYIFKTSDKRKFTVEFEQSNEGWEFSFYDDTYSYKMTGQGNALEIFATVKDIALHFFKKYKPKDAVIFSAALDEPSRVKFYNRAVKQISSAIPGYKVVQGNNPKYRQYVIVPEDNTDYDYIQDAEESIQVNELLDKPLPYKQRDDDDDWKSYMFKTSDGRRFTVVMDNLPMDVWDIAFTDDEMSSDKTGKGGAVEIFATVGAIIKEFIQKNDPRAIKFSAIDNEPSRVKLYKRLAAMGAKQFPQYKLDVRNAAGGADFILKKEEQQENINELFNRPLKYNKVVGRASDEGKKLTWRFDTPKGNRITVEAHFEERRDLWEIGFYDDEADDAKMTGKGDAAQVFATVIAIGEEFLADVKPKMVEWFADVEEPSRVKLYNRMVKTLAQRMPDYDIKSQNTGGSYQRYVMIRKDSVNESVYRDLEEFVTKNQLNDVERFAEKLFKKYNIDVDFTRHFFDRINDERNVKIGGSEITVPELQKLFKKEQRQWGKKIAQLPDGDEGVMKDKETNINVPFVKKDMPEPQPDKLITKTAMKKPNFKSNTPFYAVESINENLFEAIGKTAAFAFGRLNPATNGHELLVNEIVKQDGDAFLYLSDRPAAMPKDPLEPKDKQAWAQASFPQIQVKLANNALLAADELYKMGYTNLIYLEGEPKMGKVIQKYNGQETAKHFFNFDNVELVQLTRDPDAEGATGMSATKLRKTVTDNDFEAFKQGITKPAQSKAKAMFNKLQAALGTTESAAGPPSGDYAAYKKSIGATSAAGPSDGSYEKSKEVPKDAPTWQRGLWEHLFTSQRSEHPYISQESRTAWIPLVSSTLRILQKEEKRTMYGAHVMGIKDIPRLMALQGKKGKQVSAFTTDEYGDLEGGVWTEGGIIAILKGTAMSSGQGDIMSKVDKQGRRVVDFGPQSPAMNIIGKYADSKAYLTAIKPIYEARARITKELQAKFGPNTSNVDPKAKHESIKEYMDVVNATLKEYTKVFKKIIFEWAESQNKNWKDTKESEYDEIVMGNFKIIKLFVKPSSRDHNQQTYQFRDYFEKNDFPFPVEYVRDTSNQHLKRFLDQNVEENLDELRIEKPGEKDTLGITRDKMPQIKKEDYAELIEYLKDNGATYTQDKVPAKQLKPIQKEFSDAGVEKALSKRKVKKPIIASQDNYIIDGHHRWLAALNTGQNVPIMRFNVSGKQLLEMILKFPKTYFKGIYEFVNEEAKSKAQQRFMGMVHAAQKGELKNPSPEVAKVANNMSKTDAEDFASTKHKGKPEHVKSSMYEDDDFDDDGNRIPIGADDAPKWTRSLFDHLFMKKGNKYDGPDRPFRKGDKEVFIPLVPAMIDKLVGGPTELYGAHSTGTQNLDRLIKMQGKKGKQISVFTTDREGQLADGVWGGGGVVAILRGNAYASSTGDIMSVVDKQGRRVLDIGPSGDLMNLEDNEDFLYGDEYPAMYKEIRSLQRSITAKIEEIIDEHGDVEGKEKAAFIKEYIDGLYTIIPKHKKTFSKLMVGWAQSQNKNWQEVHGSYDEVVMGNYKIVHIFLVGKDHQQVSKLESFMQEKAMGYTRKNGQFVEDPKVKDPFLAQLYKEGKLKLIDKTEEEFPYQVLDTYMKRNKGMAESQAIAESYTYAKMANKISNSNILVG